MSSRHKRCSIQEDRHGLVSIPYRQCRRRSHPVQRMGGVCAMCLTERLSTVARCAETARLQRPPHLAEYSGTSACRHLCLAAAGAHPQSMDSEGSDLNMSNSVSMYARRSDRNDAVCEQDISTRDSSAGSEQSIASLVEKDIDEGRQRSSNVTAGSKELLAPEMSSTDGRAAVAFSANSYSTSKQSTPASYKSNSGTAPQNCGDASEFRRCNTACAERQTQISSNIGALLTKSKSTGSHYSRNSHQPRMRSPAIHQVWSLPNFWHKKCRRPEKRAHGADASSSHDLSTSLITPQAEDSVSHTKMSRSRSMSAGAAANFMSSSSNQVRCIGKVKWFSASSFHRTRRSPSSKLSSPTGGCVCTPEPLIVQTQSNLQHVSPSSASSTHGAAGSIRSPALQVVDACIAKGLSVCRRWPRLANFSAFMLQKTGQCKAGTTAPAELGIISAPNEYSTGKEVLPGISDTLGSGQQSGHLRGHKARSGCALAEDAHTQDGEPEGGCATEKSDDCINGNLDRSAGRDADADAIVKMAAYASKESSCGSTKPDLTKISSQCASFTCTPHAECTPTLYNRDAMLMKMQPARHHQECQSIAALVSRDAHLLRHHLQV